jgi:hypothetical protein
MAILKTIQQALNDLASTTGLTAQEAANVFADTTGLSVQDALAVVNGKGKLLRQESANDLALESGLTLQEALNTLLAQSTYTVKGGVVRVIDSATGDIARTTSGWIEDEKFGVWAAVDSGTVSLEFDSSDPRTGRLVASMTTSSATSRGRFIIGYNGGTGATLLVPGLSKYGIVVKPSTSYRFSLPIKYNNLVSGSGSISVHEHNSSGARLATNNVGTLSGNSDWAVRTINFTTNAATNWVVITFGAPVAGDAQEFWADFNSMTLEEVTTITNSSGSPAYLYPKGIAVTSTDNIDQSQVVQDKILGFGLATIPYRAQQFLPTKKNGTGFVFKRGANAGSFTGNVTITLQTDNADNPSGTVLGTLFLTNAQWNAIATNTDYTVTIPTTATIDGSTKYWIVFYSSTSDSSNYPTLYASNSNSYTSGLFKYSANGTTWTNVANEDLYFKTLYSKNTTNFTVSTDTETVSVTAPTVDGWEDGTVVNIPGSLELATGSNNLYLSSNGASEADGEVDSSLQGTIRVTKRLS